MHRPRSGLACVASAVADKECWLLDYGAGNVRSIRNAIQYLGYTVRDVRHRPQGSGPLVRAHF